MTSPREDLTEKAHAAFRLAAARVVQRARLAGTPVIVGEDGRIQANPPQQPVHLELPPEAPKTRTQTSITPIARRPFAVRVPQLDSREVESGSPMLDEHAAPPFRDTTIGSSASSHG